MLFPQQAAAPKLEAPCFAVVLNYDLALLVRVLASSPADRWEPSTEASLEQLALASVTITGVDHGSLYEGCDGIDDAIRVDIVLLKNTPIA
jgi:hypothetical protein